MVSITKDPLNLVRVVAKTEIRGRSGLVNDRFSSREQEYDRSGCKTKFDIKSKEQTWHTGRDVYILLWSCARAMFAHLCT